MRNHLFFLFVLIYVDYEKYCDPHALYDYIKSRIIGKSQQYYDTNLGFGNVLLNFRQFDETHLMEKQS